MGFIRSVKTTWMLWRVVGYLKICLALLSPEGVSEIINFRITRDKFLTPLNTIIEGIFFETVRFYVLLRDC